MKTPLFGLTLMIISFILTILIGGYSMQIQYGIGALFGAGLALILSTGCKK
jgi:hypothetical protein